MSNTGYVPERFKTGTICIDSYNDKGFVGRLWYPRFECELKFNNLMQLVAAIDASVKAIGYPDEYSSIRNFGTRENKMPPCNKTSSNFVPNNGKLATFLIKIIFLQNSTWQGTIIWAEKDAEENFRSMREMIYLMDSVLENKNNI